MIRKRLKVKGPRIDYAAIAAAGGIGKGPSIQLEKGWKRAEFEKALADAYEVVNKRDRDRSRVTGRNLFASTDNLDALREHNHLDPRSTAPGRITDPANIFLVSNTEHGYITRGELLVHGTDANKELKFSWHPSVTANGKRPPFRILPALVYRGRVAA